MAQRSQKAGNAGNGRGLGVGFRKRSGLYKIDSFWALVVFPSIRRSQRPQMQEIEEALCGVPSISTAPIIYIRPRVDLGVPSISTIPMAANTENPMFFKQNAGKKERSPTNCTIFTVLRVASSNVDISNGKLVLGFCSQSGFAGFQQFRHLQRKIGAWFSVTKFCL